MKIAISEIFWNTLQGEWLYNGRPSVFLRLWGCNLKCSFCDTKYSWDIEVEKAQMLELEEIVKQIQSFSCKNLVVTWWEPSLHQKSIKLIQKELEKNGDRYNYELETNWSMQLDDDIFFDQINISPKLKSSKNPDYQLKILKWIEDRCNNYIFKFVCSDLITTTETEECIKKYNIDQKKIYIMPEGRDIQSQINQYIIQYCIKKWYNYCLRSHLILFWDWKWR